MPPSHIVCKRPGCYHSTSKTRVRDRIFKLNPIYASVIYQIPWIRWIQWIPVPFRENSVGLQHHSAVLGSRLNLENSHKTISETFKVDSHTRCCLLVMGFGNQTKISKHWHQLCILVVDTVNLWEHKFTGTSNFYFTCNTGNTFANIFWLLRYVLKVDVWTKM